MPASRTSLVSSALRLSWFAIAWNGVVGASALGIAIAAGSPATAGFALNALLDASASIVLVWRFRGERSDPAAAGNVERRAQAFIVIAMFVVAAYVAFEGIRALANSSHADESLAAFLLALLSLIVLPWLGRAKLRVAVSLPSQALRGDAVLTLAAAALAAVTLTALLLNSVLGWWWADPIAALGISVALTIEATRVAVRHRFG